MFLPALTGAVVLLSVALAVVLIRKYLLTRDVGFVWLGVAVVVWPLVSRLIGHGESVLIRRLDSGQTVGFYPLTLVESGQMSLGNLLVSLSLLHRLISVGLLLVAVLYLGKTKNTRSSDQPQPATCL